MDEAQSNVVSSQKIAGYGGQLLFLTIEESDMSRCQAQDNEFILVYNESH